MIIVVICIIFVVIISIIINGLYQNKKLFEAIDNDDYKATHLGFGTPGKEFHVEWGETITIPKTQFNVFDVARNIYIEIMEW